MKVAPRTAKTQKLADPAGVLFELGHSLNAARTQMDVVRSILKPADKLFGWDASAFDICGAEQKSFYRILAIETVKGKRVESSAKKASPLAAMGSSEMTRGGAKAVLRSQRASGR